jgi:hypothetical protein
MLIVVLIVPADTFGRLIKALPIFAFAFLFAVVTRLKQTLMTAAFGVTSIYVEIQEDRGFRRMNLGEYSQYKQQSSRHE